MPFAQLISWCGIEENSKNCSPLTADIYWYIGILKEMDLFFGICVVYNKTSIHLYSVSVKVLDITLHLHFGE